MATLSTRFAGPALLLMAVAGAALPVRPVAPVVNAQTEAPRVRRVAVTARRYSFTPPRIEVLQDDLVQIQLRTEDIAHSFTVDGYRIAKRVSPGHPVTFELRADKPGTFPIYCSLRIDDGCRRMRGELVVKPRK